MSESDIPASRSHSEASDHSPQASPAATQSQSRLGEQSPSTASASRVSSEDSLPASPKPQPEIRKDPILQSLSALPSAAADVAPFFPAVVNGNGAAAHYQPAQNVYSPQLLLQQQLHQQHQRNYQHQQMATMALSAGLGPGGYDPWRPQTGWDSLNWPHQDYRSNPLPSFDFLRLDGTLEDRSGGMQPQPGQVGRYIGVGVKRMSDQNHNKAITKRLASAVHYQQVLDVIADSVQHFDEVNVATSLHRLAKLQPNTGSNQCSALVYTPQFQQLVAAIKRLLHRFEAQAVSNTMWAFATLAYYPEGDLLDQIASHAISIMPTFRPQATSNTLWAYAKLAYAPSPAMLKASADQLERDLAKSVPQDISNTLWAFATLRHYPGRSLMAGAAAQAIITIQRFKPQEIANTLWAYATLAQDPGPGLLDAMAAQMVDRIAQFRPQAVSNSLWAYAKLGYNPGREMLDVAARKASHMLHQYTSQEIANTLWSLATLEHHPGVQMLDLAAHQIVRRIEQFSPQDIANSVWAFAKIYHYPSCDLLQAAAHYCLRHWHRFKPQEVANMFWALAILKPGAPETWRALLDKLALVPAASFDEADQHQIFQAYLLLEGQGSQLGTPSVASLFPPGLLEDAATIWKQAIHRSGRMSKLQEEVSRVLWSLGVIHRTDHITMDGLFCVDIALENDRVIIEVDGPSHFAVNSRRPLGRTIGHRSMLEARGYIVRSIPYYEWNVLEGIEEQKRYVSRLLASAFTYG